MREALEHGAVIKWMHPAVGAFVPNEDSPATRLLLPPFYLHKPFRAFPYRSSLSLRVNHRFVRAQRSLRHEC
ncbi:hypothetical protein IWW34DRAFT_45204 [Fusarium oxysporum f. sp. albedinis]|nr:hypothetical protein IWW34DRAFT_45204 [Fusarium oxysporum f. sp. albedinis]